jgi:hypothetical protein
MSEHEEIPEHLRGYFGHDKVALFGSGGMPAAPPAPPGSPARRQGEAALADALSKVGSLRPRPGTKPAVVPPKPMLPRLMRARGERALMERSMRELGARVGFGPPYPEAGWFWRGVFAPMYRAIPWGIKRRMVAMTSGVKRWRSERRA